MYGREEQETRYDEGEEAREAREAEGALRGEGTRERAVRAEVRVEGGEDAVDVRGVQVVGGCGHGGGADEERARRLSDILPGYFGRGQLGGA